MSILKLNGLARIKQAADEAYHEAWVASRSTTKRLPTDRFWAIMAFFRRFIVSLDQSDPSRGGCDELFRRVITNDMVICGRAVTFDELVSFIENWTAVTDALHKHLFDIMTDKGDDSYGDLCDNLPLIGRFGVRHLLKLSPGSFDNKSVIKHIDAENPGKDPDKWREFIWNGENYWCMFLDNEAERRFVQEACNHNPEESESLV